MRKKQEPCQSKKIISSSTRTLKNDIPTAVKRYDSVG